jgi:TM2 domain-containing membrane protein YozV
VTDDPRWVRTPRPSARSPGYGRATRGRGRQVRGALDDGRLQLDELDDRLGAVYQAKTHGELAGVIGDIVPLPAVPAPPPAVRYYAMPPAELSDRKILPAWLLCLFFGVFGAHRFYVGKTRTGIAMLVMLLIGIGAPVTVIWWLVDLVVLTFGAFRDGDDRRMTDWT